MSNKIIRDTSGNVKYKLQENKLYNTVIVRDASGNRVATYNKNNGEVRSADGKLIKR